MALIKSEPDMCPPIAFKEEPHEALEDFDELDESHVLTASEDAQNPISTPKTKRAQTNQSESKAPCKKYVPGKQGGLRGFMVLPVEVFTLIACQVTPSDLIVLSRTNKSFRKILLRRSFARVWQQAEENVVGLPPCPAGMCEPQYAALMFFKHCTLCGATATAKPDPYLLVRLCPSCRETDLVDTTYTFLSFDVKRGLYACSPLFKPKAS